MTVNKRIDTPATWTDVLQMVSNLGFRRLGRVAVSNKTATVYFDSAIGRHEVTLEPGHAGDYMMVERTNGEETDRRVLTTAMLGFIPTHIQIAYRSVGVR